MLKWSLPSTPSTEQRYWRYLSEEVQTARQVEYGYYADSLPLTCSMETKVQRFQAWLWQAKQIIYETAGQRPREHRD